VPPNANAAKEAAPKDAAHLLETRLHRRDLRVDPGVGAPKQVGLEAERDLQVSVTEKVEFLHEVAMKRVNFVRAAQYNPCVPVHFIDVECFYFLNKP